MGATVIYPGGIVQDLPRGRFWGAHNLPGYNLGGGIFSDFTPALWLSGSLVSQSVRLKYTRLTPPESGPRGFPVRI